MEKLPAVEREQAAQEDAELLEAEAQIPVGTIWDLSTSSDSDDEDYTVLDCPDDEVGGSASAAAAAPGHQSQPSVTTTQVT